MRIVLGLLLALSGCTSAPANDHAFGDSVTRYIAAADAAHGYVSLLSTATGRTITNHGADGDMVADATSKVYGVSLAATDRATIMLGINDERIYCPSPCASVDATKLGYYRRGYQALIAWLALGTKQSALTNGAYTGTWTATAVYGVGKNSNVNGSTATFTISGTTAYLGMIQQDGAPGTFDVKIDGVTVGSYTTQTVGLGPTPNGVTYGAMLLRFPGLSVGIHTVQVVVTSTSAPANRVYVDWVSGSDQTTKPSVYVGNVLRASSYSAGGSDIGVSAYNAQVASLVSELQSDGLNVTLVDASSPNYNGCMDGGYHPVNCGHAIIESLFYGAQNPAPSFSSAVIEMDGFGNFFGRLATDAMGITRKQLH